MKRYPSRFEVQVKRGRRFLRGDDKIDPIGSVYGREKSTGATGQSGKPKINRHAA